MNNNLKAPSAASRLTQLPVVQSVCATLSVLYMDTKCNNPTLRSFFEALESRVNTLSTVACTTVSPVLVKFEPQISIANDVACKTLDWLETSFPVLLSPADEVATAAKKKMHEIQDVASIVAKGTVDCVQHTVTWVTSRIPAEDGANQSVLDRTVYVASVGLDSALSLLEGLMQQVLPPIEEDKEGAHLVEGFEVAVQRGCYSERIISLGTQLCRRTCHLVGSKIQMVKVQGSSRSTPLVQDLQTICLSMVGSVQGLPQYLTHQTAALFFFFNQMYALSCPPPRQEWTHRRSRLSNSNEPSSRYKGPVYPQSTPAFRMRPARTFVFDAGSNGKGHVRC